MIGYLSGTVQWREPLGNLDQVILNVGGVGYLVLCPARVIEADIGEKAELWIHCITRDDGSKLYGFAARSDVKGFVMLLDVPGVGAKVALALIAALGWQDLMVALSTGDSARLTAADGVGKKLAERITHEMAAKVEKLGGIQPTAATGVSGSAQDTEAVSAAVSALCNLGYASHQAKGAVQRAQAQAPKASLETLITLALQLLHDGSHTS